MLETTGKGVGGELHTENSADSTRGRSLFELTLGHTGLTDDRLKCTDAEFVMVWNRDSNRRVRKLFLHYDMAPSLTNFQKSVTCEDAADLLAG